MVKAGYIYPRVSRSCEGTRKARPRNVLAVAPTYLQINYNAVARHPQPMPSTHTVVVVFRQGIVQGLTGPGGKIIPLWTTTWGPKIYKMYTPLLNTFRPIYIRTENDTAPSKSSTARTATRHRPTARKDHERNIQ